jgi:hypothetical protein
MRDQTAKVENILSFTQAVYAVHHSSSILNRLVVLSAPPGFGKTKAAAHVVPSMNGIHIRVRTTWTPGTLLQSLLKEFAVPPKHKCDEMFEQLIEIQEKLHRPIFFDEADYLLEKSSLLNITRDLHDETRTTIVFIVTDEIERRFRQLEKFGKRIVKWIKFYPCSLEDTELLASEVCEIKVAADLLAHLHIRGKGEIGNLVMGLGNIEDFAKEQKLQEIDRKQWANQKFSFEY